MTDSDADALRSAAAEQVVAAEFDRYMDKRRAYYRTVKLQDLLNKDVLMFALRGVTTATRYVEEAFRAHESSSEETAMGNTWQTIVNRLTSGAVDLGDMVLERDDVLNQVDIKSQENTFNYDSKAQAVRKLKERVQAYKAVHTGRRREVRAVIGILRGKSGRSIDRLEKFKVPKSKTENRDIEGFEFRYLVGAAFWTWLTGQPSVSHLIGNYESDAAELDKLRDEALVRLKRQLIEQLSVAGLPDSINSIPKLVST
jgi:hypothetical protein